jgi:DNA polymerase (family 10)
MAQAARAAGLKYAVVSDHSRGLGVAHGAGPEELRRQRAEVEEVNRRMGGTFRVLTGVEVEVRADGSLDLPDEVLAELDIVVAALHSGLRQPREQFTARAIAALRHPHVDILAHPTGRLLGQREGADVDMEAVLRAAAETGKAISSDSHDPEDFGLLHFGVAMARRGWASPAHILNTRSAEEVLAWASGRGRG